MPDVVRLAVTVTALTLHCRACGDTARIDARHAGPHTVAEAGSRWMVTHHDPELVSVETEAGGERAEWVTRDGRLR